MRFLFVEEANDRADHLRKQVALRTLPANFSVIIEGGITFEAALEKRYSEFMRGGRLIPTFAFIDPFGWTGAPFNLVKMILAQRNCEVFVNFMYEEINRFIGHPDQITNFNDFFGTDAWKRCVDEIDPRKRNSCLHDLYLHKLRAAANNVFVRSFEMSNARDVTDYYLFYATKELLGLKKMKEAMWKTDESGEFRFSDATDPNQLVLFEKAPKLAALQACVLVAFSSKEVSVADIERFVVVDTAFRETHYKGILKALEKEGRLKVVHAPPGRKIGTFPDPGIVIRFD
jgi:three-Cys-motif partner protein